MFELKYENYRLIGLSLSICWLVCDLILEALDIRIFSADRSTRSLMFLALAVPVLLLVRNLPLALLTFFLIYVVGGILWVGPENGNAWTGVKVAQVLGAFVVATALICVLRKASSLMLYSVFGFMALWIVIASQGTMFYWKIATIIGCGAIFAALVYFMNKTNDK